MVHRFRNPWLERTRQRIRQRPAFQHPGNRQIQLHRRPVKRARRTRHRRLAIVADDGPAAGLDNGQQRDLRGLAISVTPPFTPRSDSRMPAFTRCRSTFGEVGGRFTQLIGNAPGGAGFLDILASEEQEGADGGD